VKTTTPAAAWLRLCSSLPMNEGHERDEEAGDGERREHRERERGRGECEP
jgi:hypothetical protein